jgi:hypothetical protein
MPNPNQRSRRIALFVEGHTERALPVFIHRWLDPQLPQAEKVGITPVKFHGVSDYLDNLAQKIGLYLDERRANFVVGLVDLYGIPSNWIDLSGHSKIKDKVAIARAYMRNLVPRQYRDRFRQHFAVHEVEAWLLAYPEVWRAEVRDQIKKRAPEQVNFNEPPAMFLKRILGGYKKTTTARNLFSKLDPDVAVGKCPYLKLFFEDLLAVAKIL